TRARRRKAERSRSTPWNIGLSGTGVTGVGFGPGSVGERPSASHSVATVRVVPVLQVGVEEVVVPGLVDKAKLLNQPAQPSAEDGDTRGTDGNGHPPVERLGTDLVGVAAQTQQCRSRMDALFVHWGGLGTLVQPEQSECGMFSGEFRWDGVTPSNRGVVDLGAVIAPHLRNRPGLSAEPGAKRCQIFRPRARRPRFLLVPGQCGDVAVPVSGSHDPCPCVDAPEDATPSSGFASRRCSAARGRIRASRARKSRSAVPSEYRTFLPSFLPLSATSRPMKAPALAVPSTRSAIRMVSAHAFCSHARWPRLSTSKSVPVALIPARSRRTNGSSACNT